MKLFLSLIIIVAALQLPAQRITVSGKISGEKKDSVGVCFNQARNEWRNFAVDNSNRFSFSFEPDKEYHFISVENDEIVLQPGDSIFVSLQGDSIIDISGGNAILNESLLNLQHSDSHLWKSSGEDSLVVFQNKLMYWYDTKVNQINACKYANSNADRDIALSYVNFQVAAVSYAFLSGITIKNDTLQYAASMKSNEFKRFSELRIFNDTVLGQSLQFYLALKEYLNCFMAKEIYDIVHNVEHNSYLQTMWNFISGMNMQKENNDVAYMIMSDCFFTYGCSYFDSFFYDADSILHYFEKTAYDKRNAAYITDNFTQSYDHLRPGRQIPDVELYDTLGNRHLLSDYKDKIIYVKLWTTGCKGCIQLIPSYNDFIANFKDTNVVFMSIAMQSRKHEDWWREAIIEYDLHGLNFISKNGLNLEQFGLNHGFPRSYIIGKGNTIVNLNAPGPRSSELKAMLEELVRVEGK